eukprot:scaffold7399_cov87-Skeletonema_dohrnii-CCMP3373.AAC.2
MHSVAGDSAASPALPTVLPTKELSIFDSNGCIRYMPSAGTANLSICRLDESDAFSFSSETFVSVSFSPAKHTVKCGECIRGKGGKECFLIKGSEAVGR